MIEKLYAILTEENGEETVCGMKMPGQMPRQAVSSRLDLIQKKLSFFEHVYPEKKFKLISFIRESE